MGSGRPSRRPEGVQGVIYHCSVHGRNFSVEVPRAATPSASVERLEEGLWAVTIRGRRFEVKVQDALERRLARETAPSARRREERILAPMPGVVTRVAVSKGQKVSAGDLLLVLEAMKMANEVCAKAPGIVREVSASPGRTVAAGEVLVTLG